MKIAVLRADGTYFIRPDNTLNHNNSDYYCPEGVTSLEAVPCLYTHIDKAGKCVAERFARRYCSKFAFGGLLRDSSQGALASESAAMDFTSIMDMDFAPLETLPQSSFFVAVDGLERFALQQSLQIDAFTRAICSISARCTLRIGDIVALELGSAGSIAAGSVLSLITGAKRVEIKIF